MFRIHIVTRITRETRVFEKKDKSRIKKNQEESQEEAMKLRVIVIVCLCVLLVGVCIWRYYDVQKNSQVMSQRARSALAAGGSNEPSVLVCLRNRGRDGFQVSNFIQHALVQAASPLRVSFAVVDGPTASVPVDREVEYLSRRVNIRLDVRTACAHHKSWFAFVKYWKSLYRSERVVVIVDCCTHSFTNRWDSKLVEFITKSTKSTNSQNSSYKGTRRLNQLNKREQTLSHRRVFSAPHPSSFCVLKPSVNTCGWPVIDSRLYLYSREPVSVPSSVVDPSMLVFDGRSFSSLGLPDRQHVATSLPAFCGPLLLTDWLLQQSCLPYTLPCDFFSSSSSTNTELTLHTNLTTSNTGFQNREVCSRLSTLFQNKDSILRLSDVCMKWVGIRPPLEKDKDEFVGFVLEPRALCGLFHTSFIEPESILEALQKYGSQTQAQAQLFASGATSVTESKNESFVVF